LFFLHCSPPPRVLHSFPTRRSSDLRQAALLREALDALEVKRAIIVGYSWSGALATALALAYPERVAGLVLIAPVTHPWPGGVARSEEHTSELQSQSNLVCRLLLAKK